MVTQQKGGARSESQEANNWQDCCGLSCLTAVIILILVLHNWTWFLSQMFMLLVCFFYVYVWGYNQFILVDIIYSMFLYMDGLIVFILM